MRTAHRTTHTGPGFALRASKKVARPFEAHPADDGGRAHPFSAGSRPIARIRSAKPRPYTCRGCGRECTSYALVGATPTRCYTCNPSSFRSFVEGVLRADLAAAHAKIAELEEQLAQEVGGRAELRRATACGEPGRDALARAVLRLTRRGDVVGVRDTIDALLTISAIARAWAARLGVREEHKPASRDLRLAA